MSWLTSVFTKGARVLKAAEKIVPLGVTLQLEYAEVQECLKLEDNAGALAALRAACNTLDEIVKAIKEI